MPEPIKQNLEELLCYPKQDVGDDLFVVDVMRQIQKQRRTRKLILVLFGGIGALFGLLGAILLSADISRLFTETLTVTTLMQLPLFAAGASALYIWFMNDDLSISP